MMATVSFVVDDDDGNQEYSWKTLHRADRITMQFLIYGYIRRIECFLFTQMVPDDVVTLLLQYYTKHCVDQCDKAITDLIKLYKQQNELNDDDIALKLKNCINQLLNECIKRCWYNDDTAWNGKKRDYQLIIHSLIHIYDIFTIAINETLDDKHIFHDTVNAAFKTILQCQETAFCAFINNIFDINKQTVIADLEKIVKYVIILLQIQKPQYSWNSNFNTSLITKYECDLAHRLSQQSCQYTEIEEGVIRKIHEMDIYNAHSLQDLLNGIKESHELNELFSKELNDKFPIKFRIFISSYLSWPLVKSQHVKQPLDNDIIDCIYQCKQAYYDKYNNKKTLCFQMNEGRACIEIEFNSTTTKILNVSTYQMMILILFNQKDVYTLKEILDCTRIPIDDLYLHIMSMVDEKTKILQKIPDHPNLENTDSFRINSNYSNKKKCIDVPVIMDHRNQCYSMVQLYRSQMDAAIVRTMKARKTLKFNDLQNLVELQLQFNGLSNIPNLSSFEQRVSSLVYRGYMEIDENDKELYHYKM